MANKYFRKNLNKGGGADKDPMNASDMQKEREKRNRKKFMEKFKRAGRPEFSKGGGADTGRMGELKSKLAVAGMKAKDVMGKNTRGLTKKQIERLKELFDRNKNKFVPKGNPEKFMIPLRELKSEVKPMRMKRMKKGGRATLKKGSKFPDLTGDGKVTRADILKGRGAFSKGSKPKNIKDLNLTRAKLGQFTIAGRFDNFKKKLKKFGSGKK
jgi:hypothetical protein